MQAGSLLALVDCKRAKKYSEYFPGRALCIPSPGTAGRYQRKPNFSRLLTLIVCQVKSINALKAELWQMFPYTYTHNFS